MSRPALAATPTESPAERKARQLATLRRLGELTMGLAEAAAAKAAQHLAEPGPPEPDGKQADPVLAFTRLSRAVRQTIALEIRVASDDVAPHRPPPPDPRRPLLRRALHRAAAADPGRPGLKREIDARIEHELLADPEGDAPLGEVFATICDGLALPFDPSQLPDTLLGLEPIPGSAADAQPGCPGCLSCGEDEDVAAPSARAGRLPPANPAQPLIL
jgi:hypothetical protein